jgi:hypothetical protein
LDRPYGVLDEVSSGHVFRELGNVQISVEHKHCRCDSVNDAGRSEHGRWVAVVVSRTEAFDDPVDLLRLGFEVQFGA